MSEDKKTIGMSYVCVPINSANISNNWCTAITKVLTNYKADNYPYDMTVYVPKAFINNMLTISSYAVLQAINDRHVHIVEVDVNVDDAESWQALVTGWIVNEWARLHAAHIMQMTPVESDKYWFYIMTDHTTSYMRNPIISTIKALNYNPPHLELISVKN